MNCNYSDRIYRIDGTNPLLGYNSRLCWTLTDTNKPEVGDYLFTYECLPDDVIKRYYCRVNKVTKKSVYVASNGGESHKLAWSKLSGNSYILSNSESMIGGAFRWYVKADEFPHFATPTVTLD
jgi:hypothetical protein